MPIAPTAPGSQPPQPVTPHVTTAAHHIETPDILRDLEAGIADTPPTPLGSLPPSESGVFEDIEIASPKRKKWFRRATHQQGQAESAYPSAAGSGENDARRGSLGAVGGGGTTAAATASAAAAASAAASATAAATSAAATGTRKAAAKTRQAAKAAAAAAKLELAAAKAAAKAAAAAAKAAAAGEADAGAGGAAGGSGGSPAGSPSAEAARPCAVAAPLHTRHSSHHNIAALRESGRSDSGASAEDSVGTLKRSTIVSESMSQIVSRTSRAGEPHSPTPRSPSRRSMKTAVSFVGTFAQAMPHGGPRTSAVFRRGSSKGGMGSVRSQAAEEGILALKRGVPCVKYSRKGKQRLTNLRLSDDEAHLLWDGQLERKAFSLTYVYSRAAGPIFGKRRDILIADVLDMSIGQQSAVFVKHMHRAALEKQPVNKPHLSLSLILMGALPPKPDEIDDATDSAVHKGFHSSSERLSLDLSVDDEEVFGMLIAGLRALLDEGQQRPAAYPAPFAPLHASVGAALRLAAPADATVFELWRDRSLVGLDNYMRTRTFIVLSAIWVTCVVVFGIMYVVFLLGWHGLPFAYKLGNTTYTLVAPSDLPPDIFAEMCPPTRTCVPMSDDPTTPPTQPEMDSFTERFPGGKWASPMADYYGNVAIHILTALFSYITLFTLPWRIANAVHLWGCCCTRRSCEAGVDFYGRPTKGIWFHIPPPKRKPVVFLLCGNAFMQYATQLCRFIWSSFDASQVMPGVLLINLTFVSGIICGIASGSMQGNAENAVRKEKPGEFPPTPVEVALAAWKAEREKLKNEMRKGAAAASNADSSSSSPPTREATDEEAARPAAAPAAAPAPSVPKVPSPPPKVPSPPPKVPSPPPEAHSPPPEAPSPPPEAPSPPPEAPSPPPEAARAQAAADPEAQESSGPPSEPSKVSTAASAAPSEEAPALARLGQSSASAEQPAPSPPLSPAGASRDQLEEAQDAVPEGAETSESTDSIVRKSSEMRTSTHMMAMEL